MRPRSPSKVKTWIIEYPVMDELWHKEIQGETLEHALTQQWGRAHGGFEGNFELKVRFFFGNEAWCQIVQKDSDNPIQRKIKSKNGKQYAYQVFGNYRIINVLRGDKSGYPIHEELTNEQLEERKKLYKRSFTNSESYL